MSHPPTVEVILLPRCEATTAASFPGLMQYVLRKSPYGCSHAAPLVTPFKLVAAERKHNVSWPCKCCLLDPLVPSCMLKQDSFCVFKIDLQATGARRKGQPIIEAAAATGTCARNAMKRSEKLGINLSPPTNDYCGVHMSTHEYTIINPLSPPSRSKWNIPTGS